MSKRINVALQMAVMSVAFGGAVLPAMGEELLYQKFNTSDDLAGWTPTYGTGANVQIVALPAGRAALEGQTGAFAISKPDSSTGGALEANIVKAFPARTINYAAGEVLFLQYQSYSDVQYAGQNVKTRAAVGPGDAGDGDIGEGAPRMYTYNTVSPDNAANDAGQKTFLYPGVQTPFTQTTHAGPVGYSTDWTAILDKSYTNTTIQRVVGGQTRIEQPGAYATAIFSTAVAPTPVVQNMYLVNNFSNVGNNTLLTNLPNVKSTYGAQGTNQVGILWARTGVTKSTDFNLDYKTDLNDASVLLTNFGATAGKSMAQGDATGDGAVNLDDASALLSNWGGSFDTAVGTAKGSVDGVGSIMVDLKGLALWKVFVGNASHTQISGTSLLSKDAGTTSLSGFGVGVTKQDNIGKSPEDFGAFTTSNIVTTGTVNYDPDTGDITGYSESVLKDTKVNVNLAGLAAAGDHLWLQYQTLGNQPQYVEITAVPEPTTLLSLVGISGAALLARRRKH